MDKTWKQSLKAALQRNSAADGTIDTEIVVDAAVSSNMADYIDKVADTIKKRFKSTTDKGVLTMLTEDGLLIEYLKGIRTSSEDPYSAMDFNLAYTDLVKSIMGGSAGGSNGLFSSRSAQDVIKSGITDYDLPFNTHIEEGGENVGVSSGAKYTMTNKLTDNPFMTDLLTLLGVITPSAKQSAQLEALQEFCLMISVSSLLWDAENLGRFHNELIAPSDKIDSAMPTELKAYFQRAKTAQLQMSASTYYEMQGPLLLMIVWMKSLNLPICVELLEKWAPELVRSHDPMTQFNNILNLPVSGFVKELMAGWKLVDTLGYGAESVPVMHTESPVNDDTIVFNVQASIAFMRLGMKFSSDSQLYTAYTKAASLLGGSTLSAGAMSVKTDANPYTFTKHGQQEGASLSGIDDINMNMLVDDGFNMFNSSAATLIAANWAPGALNMPPYTYGLINRNHVESGLSAFISKYNAKRGAEAWKSSSVPCVFFSRVIPDTLAYAAVRDEVFLDLGPVTALPYEAESQLASLVEPGDTIVTMKNKQLCGDFDIPFDQRPMSVTLYGFNDPQTPGNPGKYKNLDSDSWDLLSTMLGVRPEMLSHNYARGGVVRRFISQLELDGSHVLHTPAVVRDQFFRAAVNGFWHIPRTYFRGAYVVLLTDALNTGAAGLITSLPNGPVETKRKGKGIKNYDVGKAMQSTISQVVGTEGWVNSLRVTISPVNLYSTYSSAGIVVAQRAIFSSAKTYVDMTSKVGWRLKPGEVISSF